MGEALTAMKLIKLVYLAHAWHLGFKKSPLLSETVEAWKYGPVIRSLYHRLKEYGGGPVTSPISTPFFHSEVEIDSDTKGLLDAVFKAYQKVTALQLSTWTHQKGTPWWEIWEDNGGKYRKSAPIPNETIKAYFTKKHAAPSDNAGL